MLALRSWRKWRGAEERTSAFTRQDLAVCHELRFGDVGVTLASDDAGWVRSFVDLHSGAVRWASETDQPAAMKVELSVAAEGRGWVVRSRGQRLYEVGRLDDLVAHLDWAVHWAIAQQAGHRVVCHGGALVRDERALVLPAASGSGKSTLTAALQSRGWRVLSDELVVIEPETSGVLSVAKAVCVKQGSACALGGMGVSPWAGRWFRKPGKGRVGYVPVESAGVTRVGGWPVGMVLTVQYTGAAAAVLCDMSAVQAELVLLAQTLHAGAGTAGCLRRMTREAVCGRLTTGDLEASCRAIEDLWDCRVAGTAA